MNENGKRIIEKYGIVFVLIIMIILVSIIKPTFLSPNNLFNVLTQVSIYGIMAMGISFVIISKGIDLSVGSLLALSGVISCSLIQVGATKIFPNLGTAPLFVFIIVAIGIGGLCGAVSGVLISKSKLPAFIATLAMMVVARGFALIFSKGKPVSNLVPSVMNIGGKIFGVIPVPILIFLFVVFISTILLNHTQFGKNVFAIGGNIKAAQISGINVSKNLIWIYIYCGSLAGVAAIVFAGRVGSIHPGAAMGYELTAIAAATIGGTSHSGGIGTVWGTFVGALVLGVLRNGLTLMGVDAYWQQIVEGVIIAGAVMIDMRKNSKN